MTFDVADNFKANTADHQLEIIRDEAPYRHLRCRKPGTGIWGWDIITWPGYLAITGDIGTFTFCRETDMIRDFFSGPVNVGYWLEKCKSWDRSSSPAGDLSMDSIREHLASRGVLDKADMIAIEDAVNTNDSTGLLHELMRAYPDAWDWDVREPDSQAVRCLYAISWTRNAYLKAVAS